MCAYGCDAIARMFKEDVKQKEEKAKMITIALMVQFSSFLNPFIFRYTGKNNLRLITICIHLSFGSSISYLSIVSCLLPVCVCCIVCIVAALGESRWGVRR